MRRFTRQILIFFLFLIPPSLFLDYFISEKLRKVDSSSTAGELEVWNDIFNSKIDAEIAIYGSSRAWVHLDPQIIEEKLEYKTYNLGIDGHTFEMQYLRHQEYFKHCEIPKIIILAIDEHSFATGNWGYNKDQFLPYLLWELNPLKAELNYNYFTLLESLVPLWRFSGKGDFILSSIELSKIQEDSSTYRVKGYKGMDQKWNNDLSNAQKTQKNVSLEIDKSSVPLFLNFITELKDKDINLILVNTPKYIEGQGYIKNRDSILSMIQNIAEKREIPFLDYSNDSISFNRDLFYNSMHLNKTGAEIFTRKLAMDLESKNLIHGR